MTESVVCPAYTDASTFGMYTLDACSETAGCLVDEKEQSGLRLAANAIYTPFRVLSA